MLTRRYELITDTLFLISNGCEFGSLQQGLWNVPTESELQSPSLRIELVDKNKQDWFFADACIRYPVMSGAQYEPINSEIQQALLGKSDSWKLTRCSAGYDAEYRANVAFMLINPDLYRREIVTKEQQNDAKDRSNFKYYDCFDWGDDYSDLERGRVFVYLKPPEKNQLRPQHFRVNYVKSVKPLALPHQSIEVVTSGVDIIASERHDNYFRQTSTNVRLQKKDGPVICHVHEDWI